MRIHILTIVTLLIDILIGGLIYGTILWVVSEIENMNFLWLETIGIGTVLYTFLNGIKTTYKNIFYIVMQYELKNNKDYK